MWIPQEQVTFQYKDYHSSQAVVTDPLEAGGDDMEQKAAKELIGRQSHLAGTLRLRFRA